ATGSSPPRPPNRSERARSQAICESRAPSGSDRPGSRADRPCDRRDDTFGRAPVNVTDDGPDDTAPLVCKLTRLCEAALDSRDDVLEPVCPQKGAGIDKLPVVLADDVLQRPRFARGRTLVVENADRRAVVHECIEQDRSE